MMRLALCVTIGTIAVAAPSASLAGVERRINTASGHISVERLSEGLNHPWGMAFLPDGRLLVTERAGRLRILGPDGGLSDPVEGVPEVVASGQGGMLIVVAG